jgi:hypothetical protein
MEAKYSIELFRDGGDGGIAKLMVAGQISTRQIAVQSSASSALIRISGLDRDDLSPRNHLARGNGRRIAANVGKLPKLWLSACFVAAVLTPSFIGCRRIVTPHLAVFGVLNWLRLS